LQTATAAGGGAPGDVIKLNADITNGNSQLDIARDLTLDLNGKNLTITEKSSLGSCIVLATGVRLTIMDSHPGSNKLIATNIDTGSSYSSSSSGYGCGINTSHGTVIIESGTVVATGGYFNAGINTSYGTLIINGGTVEAVGADMCAGIGGYNITDGSITINGGTVVATGGFNGAGIGGGHTAGGGNITINGGTVVATGTYGAAGIGSGYAAAIGGNITITGGDITALSSGTGSWSGAGIGGGGGVGYGAAGNILITGENTKVKAMGRTGANGAQDIGPGTGNGAAGNVLVAIPQANLTLSSPPQTTANAVLFTATPASAGGTVTAMLPAPFNQTVDLMTGLGSGTEAKTMSVITTFATDEITFALSGGYTPVIKNGTALMANGATVAFTSSIINLNITFEPANPLHLEDGDYTLAATAGNGVMVKFRIDGSTAAANIDAGTNTLLHLLRSGSVTVTAYIDAPGYQAAEVSRTIAIVSNNTNVSTVTVSNTTPQQGVANLYLADCGATLVQVTVTPEESGSQVIYKGTTGNSFTVDISSPGIHEVKYTVRSSDGSTKEYSLQIERSLAFADIVDMKFNNVLYVNNNPASNGGYTFTRYQWYRNGQPIGIDQQYYTAGSARTDQLDPTAEYSVAVTTAEGKVLHVCPGKVTLKPISSLRAYPNPVSHGKQVRLESDTAKDGSLIRLYNITGGLIDTQQMFGGEAQLTAPQATGVYMITVDSENVKIRVE
jgi:hypothetical protein